MLIKFSNNFLIISICNSDYGNFDFIITGAGSSGSVVASRLSEHANWKVLLLEAGDHETDLSEIPGLHVLLPNSDKNWGYTTTKQNNGCLGNKFNNNHSSVPTLNIQIFRNMSELVLNFSYFQA